ncbi:MAG: hypothetical protein KatS3mg060_0756 [Dehalococcoidia bacterium]|nr:MAG: hypothetical protein KatS3mg060_0756 [Dehalococcoidia bacterium]
MNERRPLIRTPDQRLRVFVSSTLGELAPERAAVKAAIERLRLAPVLFEMGARPHPPRELYRAYLAQSDIFLGIYWQSYGWVAPGEEISGLEDEYRLSGGKPRLIYLKEPAPERQGRLATLLAQIRDGETVSYQKFRTAEELGELVANDLALLLTERFAQASAPTPEPARHNVPIPRGRLIGREKELAQLIRLIEKPDVALVTLTGPGGSGKTRLALEAAEQLIDRFPDGVWFVPLASVRQPELVPSVIARSLGVPEQVGEPADTALRRSLRAKSLLLVLDNFEHVIDAGPFVVDLLLASPGLRVLATSRAPLRVRGEHELPVPPLAVASDAGAIAPADELFVERALEVRPDLEVTDQTLEVIRRLTARLDGLPLAIELAAARMRLLSPEALLDRLDRPLDFLSRGPRDLPPRQQTLRATISWSYDLLDDEAKRLFRRLAVFRGWTLRQAEDVCGDGDVVAALERLIDGSLVQRLNDDSDPRYSMLETIREYATEQLAASAEEGAIRRRHAGHFLAVAEESFPPIVSRNRLEVMEQLAREYENLIAALEWAFGADGDIEIGCRITGTVCWFWYFRSLFGDLRRWSAAARRAVEQVPTVSDRARSRAAFAGGFAAYTNADPPTADRLLAEAIDLARAVGDEHLIPWGLTLLGITRLDHPDDALRSLFDEALQRFRASGEEWGEAFALTFSAIQDLNDSVAGNLDRSRASLERAIALFHELGDPWGEGMAMNSYCYLLVAEGKADDARVLYETAIATLRQTGDRWALTWAVAGLGLALIEGGRIADARAAFTESLQLAAETGTHVTAAPCTIGLAVIALLDGDRDRAAELTAVALRLIDLIPIQSWVTFRVARERGLAILERELDPALREAARQRVAALDGDQLVRLALGGGER